MSQPDTKRFTIPDAVLYQQLGDEIILFNPTTELFHGLDEVGSRVWQLLEEHGTIETLVTALLDEYEVDEVTLGGDIVRLLDELVAAGLLQTEEGPGA